MQFEVRSYSRLLEVTEKLDGHCHGHGHGHSHAWSWYRPFTPLLRRVGFNTTLER